MFSNSEIIKFATDEILKMKGKGYWLYPDEDEDEETEVITSSPIPDQIPIYAEVLKEIKIIKGEIVESHEDFEDDEDDREPYWIVEIEAKKTIFKSLAGEEVIEKSKGYFYIEVDLSNQQLNISNIEWEDKISFS